MGSVNYAIQNKAELAVADFNKSLEINNDIAGVHLIKGLKLKAANEKVQAAKEYRAFIKDADIVYYDIEIAEILTHITREFPCL